MGAQPPQLEATYSVGKTIRYTATAAVNVVVSRGQLLDSLVLATGSTAAYRVLDAVKVRSIRIWGNAPGTGAVQARTSSVQWLSSYSPAKVVSDSGVGATYGARVYSKPPAMSLAGFWSLTGINESEAVFWLTLNEGDIVDLAVSARIQNNVNGEDAPAAVTVVGATVGTVYQLALDFVQSGAAAVIIPVAYNTIT